MELAYLLRKTVYSAWRRRPVLIMMAWKTCRSMAHNLQSTMAAFERKVREDSTAVERLAPITFDGGCPLAVVEDGELSKDFARCHGAQGLLFSRHFHFAIWKVLLISEST